MFSSLPAEVGGVFLGEFGPLLWKVIEGEDRRNRTDRHASSTIDTFNRIDIEHLRISKLVGILLGVDAIHRASVDASGIFGPNAGLCNYVSHFLSRLACLSLRAEYG
jgi:hypothetical protein